MPKNSHPECNQSYFRYWGKAAPAQSSGARYHLLPFHSLDVAACGRELLKLPRFGVDRMAAEIGWSSDALEHVFVAMLAVHDIGKFSRAFQSLVPYLGEPLVPPATTMHQRRHDAAGWVLLEDCFYEGLFPGLSPDCVPHEFWQSWCRLVAGHHGRPPKQEGLELRQLFLADDIAAARSFLHDVFALLHPEPLPFCREESCEPMLRLSWRLAGLAVLADWLGSNADYFPPQEEPQDLKVYWEETALPQAQRAIFAAGLGSSRARSWSGAQQLFSFPVYTPLQKYAAHQPLAKGPQLFLLEDVTGAGKTEAALLLAHRLMAAGDASGPYFGLPTMATANQLYQRVGEVYTKLYEAGETPSLVLSHGAAKLVQGFRQSILHDGCRPPERAVNGKQQEPPTASAQCAAWLADSRKKAMLADVGVGTVDQALLGVLPVRHQSLRLLGLAGKVLIVDEVHAYDGYTGQLLQELVEAQAMAGGSTILLSATVPAKLRQDLVKKYYAGAGIQLASAIEPDVRYPLATHATVEGALTAEAFSTRPDLVRAVRIEANACEDGALGKIVRMAQTGRAVCWIRNTVEDARRAYEAVCQLLPPSHVMLFHARFAMGDRLEIEQEVLQRFGKSSTAAARCGQILVATQVVEQSLDLDFDELLSDLAPVDLLIQRAGRLHRHVRDAKGEPLTAGQTHDGRGAPTLHLLAPERTPTPAATWYAALFPKAQSVYPDAGRLWLTLEALLDAGQIISPGTPGEPGGVRSLIEFVYNEDADIPENLERATRDTLGKLRADKSLGKYNALKLSQGYCDMAGEWDAQVETPTRLGEDNRTVYLAREENGALVPFIDRGLFSWEMSAVSLRSALLNGLAPAWEARFASQLKALRSKMPLLSDEQTLVLPLVPDEDVWLAQGASKDKTLTVKYAKCSGLDIK